MIAKNIKGVKRAGLVLVVGALLSVGVAWATNDGDIPTWENLGAVSGTQANITNSYNNGEGATDTKNGKLYVLEGEDKIVTKSGTDYASVQVYDAATLAHEKQVLLELACINYNLSTDSCDNTISVSHATQYRGFSVDDNGNFYIIECDEECLAMARYNPDGSVAAVWHYDDYRYKNNVGQVGDKIWVHEVGGDSSAAYSEMVVDAKNNSIYWYLLRMRSTEYEYICDPDCYYDETGNEIEYPSDWGNNRGLFVATDLNFNFDNMRILNDNVTDDFDLDPDNRGLVINGMTMAVGPDGTLYVGNNLYDDDNNPYYKIWKMNPQTGAVQTQLELKDDLMTDGCRNNKMIVLANGDFILGGVCHAENPVVQVSPTGEVLAYITNDELIEPLGSWLSVDSKTCHAFIAAAEEDVNGENIWAVRAYQGINCMPDAPGVPNTGVELIRHY
ncbi:hypothetical protein FWF93_00280 [Candidatus Saccharibacteria bacterium]|nr:hypothetical protein [Candidatus Saccharibacteria bacterium]